MENEEDAAVYLAAVITKLFVTRGYVATVTLRSLVSVSEGDNN